jgi:hypothetical protein
MAFISVFTPLTGWHCKLRPKTGRWAGAMQQQAEQQQPTASHMLVLALRLALAAAR